MPKFFPHPASAKPAAARTIGGRIASALPFAHFLSLPKLAKRTVARLRGRRPSAPAATPAKGTRPAWLDLVQTKAPNAAGAVHYPARRPGAAPANMDRQPKRPGAATAGRSSPTTDAHATVRAERDRIRRILEAGDQSGYQALARHLALNTEIPSGVAAKLIKAYLLDARYPRSSGLYARMAELAYPNAGIDAPGVDSAEGGDRAFAAAVIAAGARARGEKMTG